MSDTIGFDREQMLEMYVFECNQLLEGLEETLLTAESKGEFTPDSVNEIFRIMHTIKGSSAMMMFTNLSTLTHSLEDLFAYIRDNHPKIDDISSVCDLVLTGQDFILDELTSIKEGNAKGSDEKPLVAQIKERLERLKNGYSSTPPAPVTEAELTVPETPAVQPPAAPVSADAKEYQLRVQFDQDSEMVNIRAFHILNTLSDICDSVEQNPEDLFEADSSAKLLSQGMLLKVRTAVSYDELRSTIEKMACVRSVGLEEETAATDAPSSVPVEEQPVQEDERYVPQPVQRVEEEKREEIHHSIKQSLISVNVNKLDELMNLTGEIVISESMVTRNPDVLSLDLENFEKAARQLRKLIGELQDVVMSLRMVPIAGVFGKMQRIVRDMSKQLKKDVQLDLIGEETEVDKNSIDILADPLMHLIRNSMDHGLEDVEQRIAAGKPAKGKITLHAQNTGGDVLISLSDDGKGLDRTKILKKAREKGLIQRPDEEISDKEVFALILLPGFSTKEQVTEFSGRGVGMDVVRQNIEKIGGTIQIDSKPNEGTVTTIKIPLTLAIIEGMELAVGENIYTLPTKSIIESFRPEKKDIIVDPDGNEMILIRGNCYPIIRLHRLFGAQSVEDLTQGILILIENDDQRVCLFADRLLGEQQVVVKPLPTYLTKVMSGHQGGIGGCTILGDGNISLIIDSSKMVRGAYQSVG